jgi:hypothetical protein
MNARGAALSIIALSALALGAWTHAARGGSSAPRPVTATPPLQAVPATSVSKNAQRRMRDCNAAAETRKLAASARETFIKGCMAPRHRTPSAASSQAKANP